LKTTCIGQLAIGNQQSAMSAPTRYRQVVLTSLLDQNFRRLMGFFTPLCRVIQRPAIYDRFKEDSMKQNYLQASVGFAAITLLLLVIPPTATAQQVKVFDSTTFASIVPAAPVSLHNADGTVTTAKFLFEIILLDDGRANGGIGVWESHVSAPLFYRVVSGRRRGAFYAFKAARLSNPALEITVNFQPVGDSTPTGSVTFFIDGIPRGDGTPSSLTTNGRLEKVKAPFIYLADFSAVQHINAPSQTVQIATATDLVLATFSTTVLVFPTVGAMGFLRMTTPSGETTDHFYGTGVYKSVDGGRTWMFAASAENPLTPGDPIMVMIRPHPDPIEVCRIYDIAGTQVSVPMHFEAETDVTTFKLPEQ